MQPEASGRHEGVSTASPANDPAAGAGLAVHPAGTAGRPGDSRGFATLATWAGVATAMIGGGYLAAWLAGWMAHPGFTATTVKTNGALCLLLSGLALVLLVPLRVRRARLWAARACAALALLIGALTLSEHVIGWDLGIDQLLAGEPPGAMGAPSPNRMGPLTSTSAILAGVALLLLSRRDRRGVRWAQGLALGVCLIALLCCIGYLYDARAFYAELRLTGIAWPAAVALLLLGVGLLYARPGEGLMAQMTADDPGGLTIRRLLIPILVLVVVIGWVRLAGERLGLYDAAHGTTVAALVAIILFGALIYYAGRRLSRSAAALRESEERFRGTFENAAVGISHMDAEGRWLRANHKLREMLGYSQEELRGLRFADITPPEDREEDLRQYGLLMRGEIQSYAGEKRYMHKDGSLSWMRVSRSVQRYESGAVAYSISIVEDITARKQAEGALAESRQRLAGIVDSAMDAIITVDAQQRIVLFNPAAEKMFRCPADQALGSPVERFIPHRFREAHGEHIRKFGQTGETARAVGHLGEISGLRSDDEEFPVEASISQVQVGQHKLFTVILRDITERKRAVEALRSLNENLEQRVAQRTAEVEHRTDQLRQLASELARAEQQERGRVAGVLHDHLQQLLVGAKFGTSVLRGRLADESQRQALRKVDDLLNESLETSRNLTTELSPPILKEGTLAAALHWLASWMHDKHGLQVHVKTDKTLNPQDEGVRILLFESVRELLFNVIKHARTDSACATLERGDSEHLRIIVADAGPGFDPEPHRRHDRSRGGFGLFSIRERLGFIGGRFEIDSAPGQGARMTLVAPLRLPSTATAAPAYTGLSPAAEQAMAGLLASPAGQPGVSEESARIRVLVADDHVVVRNGLAQLLQMYADVEVVGLAGDGQEAIELVGRVRPDVILMDVSMPRLGGIEATRRVRSEWPHVCVIGLSMHVEEAMAGRMQEAGAAAYLVKTAQPEDLVATIRECVRQSPAVPGI